jgi:uncharacterized membrane protein YjjP (DUF1212 family)
MTNGTTSPSAESVDLLLDLGRALHTAGQPAHQLEESLATAADRLGVAVQVFSLPTGLFVSYRRPDGPATALYTIAPTATELALLGDLERLAVDVATGAVDVSTARERLAQITAAPPRWGKPETVAAYFASAAAFAVFFKGGWVEVGVSAVVGLVVGLLAVTMKRRGVMVRMYEFAASAAASFIAGTAGTWAGGCTDWIVLASGLIILLPGMMLITSAEELAHGRLASGAARMAGVGVVFLGLTFGGLVGGELAGVCVGEFSTADATPVPYWAWAPAVVLVAVGSTIRFRARPRDFGAILIASALTLAGVELGRNAGGAIGGPFIAALVLGVSANVYARLTRRPAELFETPGLALLVPGSVGLNSLLDMIEHDTASGIDKAFHMFLTATALVAGLLFASAVFRDGVTRAAFPGRR